MAHASVLDVNGKAYRYFSCDSLPGAEKMPYTLRILIENVLRNASSDEAAQRFAQRIVDAGLAGVQGGEIEYMPARVLLQDFTGVPVFVDLAAMREAAEELGGSASSINPQIPLDLVIDHSVIADCAGTPDAFEANTEMEFKRNAERYSFLKWAQRSFENVRIVPPETGICHQINVERFAQGVMTTADDEPIAYFDTVVGTDSHTTTANGIGVLSWGVGGIEAEAACLGQPVTTLVPRVVGIHLTGRLAAGVCAMDVALRFAEILRAKGVVGSFVECFGDGVSSLSATARACIANMTPEYGSTCTFFPFDEKTLAYLRVTGRSEDQVHLVEAYAKAQGLWADDAERVYGEVIDIDLSQIPRAVAGPSRPHDRIDFTQARVAFEDVCRDRGLDRSVRAHVDIEGCGYDLAHGAIAIAAVTSCTTATDPAMMVACGLLARNAVTRGLAAKPWIKRIFAPGSHATSLLLERAGLSSSLSALGFDLCGFGCMSCIGNSGPLSAEMHRISADIELSSVLSGNRNFEGRISPDVSQNYLCSPAAVIAYALAGTMDFDFETQPLGATSDGDRVFLRDIWPSDAEIESILGMYVNEALFEEGGQDLMEGPDAWKALGVSGGSTYAWDERSTYVRRAPYFDGMTREIKAVPGVSHARALAVLGDFITTDHISPAGSIASDSPAAAYLSARGVSEDMFNTYGSRRGNHEVMARGGFGNVKLLNMLADGRRGGWTADFIDGAVKPIFDAACDYRENGVDLVILAGKMYGSGSSRDWAAKAPLLLGVKAVFAESFERIHRSNLIGMGIIPLQFEEGEGVEALGLDGSEEFDIEPIDFGAGEPVLPNPRIVGVTARRTDGTELRFNAIVRVDTPTEGAYIAHGGILNYVLRSLTAVS